MSKGGKTRQRIVAEAAALFNQRGYEGCSITDLMNATGLEKGGIYRHFSSKEELAAEAFDHAWQTAIDMRMKDLDSIPNSVDRLKKFVRNCTERQSSVAGGCPLLNTAINADDGNPILRERARKALQQWRDRLCEIVRSGLKKREIRSRIDPRKLATLIIGSLEGALMISRLERNREALLETRGHLEHYLESEVRQRPRRLP